MRKDERYVSLSTWTKEGKRKRTPIWIASIDGDRVGFTTGKKTWKVRRIQRNPNVEIQSCSYKGELHKDSEEFSGVARVVDHGEKEYALIDKAIRDKYGIQYLLINFLGQFSKKHGEDCAIVISLEKEKLA